MRLAVFVLLVVAAQASAKTKLSELITLCKIGDTTCMEKAGNTLMPLFARGIKDLNIVPIDPLKVPFLSLDQTDRPVGLKLNITGSSHVGLKEATLKNFKTDADMKHLELDMDIPYYEITGTCDVGGRILLLPITGHGFCNLTASHATARLVLDMTHDAKHYKLNNLQVKLKLKKGKFLLEGLFGKNKELGDTMNRFLNENSADVLQELKPTLETVWSAIFKSILTNMFDKITRNELILA